LSNCSHACLSSYINEILLDVVAPGGVTAFEVVVVVVVVAAGR